MDAQDNHRQPRDWYRQRAQTMMDMGPIPKTLDPILLSLGFTLAHEQVDTAIVGTANPEHMRVNIELVKKDLPISMEIVHELHNRFDRLEP